MAKKDFPEAIKEKGLELENEFLFLSEVKEGKKTTHILMRAKKGRVEKINHSNEIARILPVYVKLLKTFYFTGEMMEMA